MIAPDINYTAYEEHIDEYLKTNIWGLTGGLNPKDRVSNFKKYMNSGRILEIVSVQGLDALRVKISRI